MMFTSDCRQGNEGAAEVLAVGGTGGDAERVRGERERERGEGEREK
jgi:hypothetical protein